MKAIFLILAFSILMLPFIYANHSNFTVAIYNFDGITRNMDSSPQFMGAYDIVTFRLRFTPNSIQKNQENPKLIFTVNNEAISTIEVEEAIRTIDAYENHYIKLDFCTIPPINNKFFLDKNTFSSKTISFCFPQKSVTEGYTYDFYLKFKATESPETFVGKVFLADENNIFFDSNIFFSAKPNKSESESLNKPYIIEHERGIPELFWYFFGFSFVIIALAFLKNY